MSKAFEEIAEPEVSAIWEQEILARIRAVDEGQTEGVCFEDVMRDAEDRVTSFEIQGWTDKRSMSPRSNSGDNGHGK